MQNTVSNGPSVLVIDDEEVNRIVLKKLFTKENIQSAFAENGSQGITLAKKNKPTMILLDIFMPGENGFELLNQFKTDPFLADIPIFIFSILTDPIKIEKAYEMGADGYITKPFHMKETVAKVKEILSGQEQR